METGSASADQEIEKLKHDGMRMAIVDALTAYYQTEKLKQEGVTA